MIHREASIEDLVRHLNSPSFDPLKLVNKAVNHEKPLKEQYLASVELTTTLNAHSQELATHLQEALSALSKSEKRVPHEISLLRNDVNSVSTALSERYPRIAEFFQLSRRSEVLIQLGELQQVKERLEEVRALLELASSAQPGSNKLSTRELQQLATVFQGTPDETKWKVQTQGYYGLINKIIN